MSSEIKSPRALSFESLFHAGFRMDAVQLAKGLAIRDELVDVARRALLTKLLFDHLEPELPEVSENEVQDYFERMRIELDYADSEERTERWLQDLQIGLEDGALWIERHLRVEKYLHAFIAAQLAAGADDLVEQLFVTMDLRARLVAVASVDVAAAKSSVDPRTDAIDSARRHLMTVHNADRWPELQAKLRSYGLSAADIDDGLRKYATASETVPR